ncbi:MAG: NADH:flavin oxidoreductase [Promethearchaeota archaeon]|nr:MAG: NADH:flavin oxidoreductase [Candidatus Lokiarchaeota archaeon]
MKFVKLFEPFKIKNLEIRNRIVMPAMALNFSRDGGINEITNDFYVERAKGEVGLIIIGGAGVEARGGGPTMFAIYDDKYIPGYAKFTENMHQYGAKTFVQLYHAGAYSGMPGMVSSSAIMSNLTRRVPKELSIDEIKLVQENHALAAERALKAGFDGVELLGSAGYLINQFLSPVTNKRTDEYGGSLENRLRYPLELIKLVKERVGEKMIVGMRIAGDDFVPGSNTYKESAVFAKHYANAGIDYINVTGGWHETRIPQIPMMVPQGAYAYLAENIKNAVDVPVFSSNRINGPIVAEQILRDQMADAVCMGRALIADAYLPLKTKQNKLWDIRKCVGCNQGCFDHIFTGKSVECMRNYMVSREGKINLDIKTKNPLNVLIIGAGPGGLEAARIAKILGHDVTILEKRRNLGGQANLSWVPPGRYDVHEIMDYYSAQIEHLGIQLQLGVEANLESINSYQPDVVIFATGVKYNIPDIPGIDGSLGSEVYLAEEILREEYPIGKNVVVVGGSATGMETAIWAAEQGAFNSEIAKFIAFYDLLPKEELFKRWLRGNREVTIIDMLPKLGMSVGRTTRGFLIGQLMKLGIKSILDVQINKFEGKTLLYEHENEIKKLENIDTFILATGVVPNDELFNLVKQTNPSYKLFKIGDCKKPRTMMEAIHEGFKTAYKLDK